MTIEKQTTTEIQTARTDINLKVSSTGSKFQNSRFNFFQVFLFFQHYEIVKPRKVFTFFVSTSISEVISMENIIQ